LHNRKFAYTGKRIQSTFWIGVEEMNKKMFIVVMAVLIVGTLMISGCASSSDSYDYRGSEGAAPVGGGCGVSLPADSVGAASQPAASQDSF